MSKRFSRQQLYDLVWSEPMYQLAKRYDISGRGLAKACAKSDIPVPERGYWNRLQAGQKVTKRALPARGLGMSDDVVIGVSDYGHYDWESDSEILNNPLPPPPEFEDSMDGVRIRAEKLVGKTAFVKTLDKPHRLIAKLLDKDAERRKAKLESGYLSLWDGPSFDQPFEQRRLKILNAIFTRLEQCGMKPSLRGKQARELSVTIGDQNVSFTLDSANIGKQLEKERQGYSFEERGHKDPMRLALGSWHQSGDDAKSWQDDKNGKIEKFYRDIVIEIIVTGEKYYRDSQNRHHEWLVERKAELEEKERKRQIEEERQRIERKRKYEQDCIDQLLDQANSFRQANEIRAYVEMVKQADDMTENPMSRQEFEEWAQWALAQADRIDPVKSGQYKLRPEKPEE